MRNRNYPQYKHQTVDFLTFKNNHQNRTNPNLINPPVKNPKFTNFNPIINQTLIICNNNNSHYTNSK